MILNIYPPPYRFSLTNIRTFPRVLFQIAMNGKKNNK